MHRIMPKVLLVLALALPSLALADDKPSYNLAELLYARIVTDSGDADGFAVNGSYDIGSGFFAEGLYYHLKDNSVPGDVTSNTLFLGPGYRVHFQPVDVFLSVDYLHKQVSGNGSSVTQDGYRWVWGLRSKVTDRLELNTGVEKANVGLTDTGLRLGESYEFTEGLTLRAQYVWFSDAHSWVIGLRYLY